MVKEGREKDSWVSIGRYDFHLRFSSSSFSRFAYFHSLLFFPPSFSLSLSVPFPRKNARKIFEYYSKKKKTDSERVGPIIRIDRSFLIGPFRPIKIEFFREPRKRRSNGPESDFGRS